MPDRFDESLLVSPLDEEQPPRWPWFLSLAVAVLVVVGAWVLLSGGDPEPVAFGTTSTSLGESRESLSEPPQLVAFDADPAVLFYPTVLPEGMELCSVQLGNPVSIPDVLCDPDNPARWIKLQLLEQGTPGGASIPNADGITELRRDPPSVGVVVGEGGITLEAEGISFDQLVAIAKRIPLAQPIEHADEDTVTLDEDGLSTVVGWTTSTADFRPNPGGAWDVYAPGLTLYTSPVFIEGEDRSMALGLVRPLLVSKQHGMVVGGMTPGGRYATDRSAATWIQGNRFWFVMYEGSPEDLSAKVLAMEQAIETLPSTPTCENTTQQTVMAFFSAIGAGDAAVADSLFAVDGFDTYTEPPGRIGTDAANRDTLREHLEFQITGQFGVVALTDYTYNGEIAGGLGTFGIEARTHDGSDLSGKGAVSCSAGVLVSLVLSAPQP